MVAGILATLFLSFVFYGLSDIRASATTSFGVTPRSRLGGSGARLLLLVRDVPEYGFWAVIAVMFTVFAADTAAFFVGRTLGGTAWRLRSRQRRPGRAWPRGSWP